MKKFLVGILVLFVLAVALPLAANAQSCKIRKYRNGGSSYRNADYRYDDDRNYQRRSYNRRNRGRGYYAPQGYGYYQRRPGFYRRHRNLINIGIGTGGGALLGGLVGGKRGAGWGALAGAGASTLYTYKIRPKQRRYYR
ncbi:MAG: hypothetical protein ACT4O9_01785 [Blastocatellia bacterium]